MTDVGSADLSRLLQSKRHECSSIVTSRKRKLRELFAVATQVESLPHEVLANPDAPTSTPAEWQFLQANDIIQGKKFNERNVPPRPKLSLELLKKSLANALFVAPESLPPPPQEEEEEQKDEKVVGQDEGQTKELASVTKPTIAGTTTTRTNATATESSNTTPIQATAPSKLEPPPQSDSTLQTNPPNATSIPPRTPTPNTLKPSPLLEPSPKILKNEEAKLVAPPEPPAAVSVDEAVNDALAPATEAQDASLEAPRKQAQVTFSAGTKGSPSEDATKEKAERSTEVSSGQEAEELGEAEDKIAKAAPIESVTDSARVPDPASSPESTAQSATTPAPQDISTDTSPDNEGNNLYDRSHEKHDESADEEEEEAIKSPVPPITDDLQKQVIEAPADSAEAQLLQESIRSNDAVASSVAEANSSPGGPVIEAEDSNAKPPEPINVDEKPSAEEDEKEPDPGIEEENLVPDVEKVSEEVKEIPDSQEEPPDQMEIDVVEPSTVTETQSGSLLEDTNSVSQEAPTTPQPGPKDTLPQAPERAVTRVSSGAMRLKSVSEIVGDSPRQGNTNEHTSIKRSVEEQLTPRTSTPKSPGLRQRHISAHRRDRSKGQVSTVVFGKKPKPMDDKTMASNNRESSQTTDDYYTPLFVQGFAGSSSWMQPLEKILFTANKTVATPDANLAIQDHQACKVLRRVYHLQQHDKWSLRQPKRCLEPVRSPSHWDIMLKEMKWMRTDFREERKWKMTVAKNLAYACAEWIESTPEERHFLQVPAVIPPKLDLTTDVSMADVEGDGPENQPTPDLISSADVDSVGNVDELSEHFVETISPSAIFSLQDDEVVFGLRRTAAASKLLDELPVYGGPLEVPKIELTGPEFDPDAHWRRPALPLSKYVEGQMKLVTDGPPRKRSRFTYQNEDSEDEEEALFADIQTAQFTTPPPQTTEVALFNPEMKHIRDRLHAGHQFRPPSEHPMPSQSFYECRNSSQWTQAEDDELRLLVKDYAYNWSLISSLLSTKSLFMSGAERRTPWECFERWINLEGLPADMQKTQYFKAYNSRIEAAQRIIMQQNQHAAQQASAAGGTVTPVRRRPSTPFRVERRRNQKHLTMVDAMRKLAKKRETTIQKQQHSASQNANNKKNNEAVSQRPIKTPRDYSLLRWERDQALAEKMAQFAQRQEAQRRAAIQARAQGQAGQMPNAPIPPQAGQNAGHPNPAAAAAAAVAAANGMNGVPRVPNSMVAAAAAAAVAAGQGRPRMPMQAPTNGMAGMPTHMSGGLVPPAQMNGVPQAQMQTMQNQQHRMPMPNPQPDVNLMMQAQRISNQQRAQQLQQAQHQGGPGTPNSAISNQQSPPPNMRNGVPGVNGTNGVNPMAQQTFMHNAQAIMASFNAANNNGHATPPANGLHMPSGPAGSPGSRPPFSTALLNQINALEASYRAKNPNLTPEQHRQMATEHLTRVMLAQRQNAMNAAAGGNGQPGLAGSIAATTSPHQYAALLRQQQQQQANQAAGSTTQQQQQQQQQQHQRQPSGSATPGPGK